MRSSEAKSSDGALWPTLLPPEEEEVRGRKMPCDRHSSTRTPAEMAH